MVGKLLGANRIVTSIAALVVLLAIAILLVEKYGGELTGTILSIIASVMTPTLGALFTMLVVNPLRNIKPEIATIRTATANIREDTDQLKSISVVNGEKIGEIRVLVDGTMTSLREDLSNSQTVNAALAVANTALASEVAQLRQDLRSMTIVDLIKNAIKLPNKTAKKPDA